MAKKCKCAVCKKNIKKNHPAHCCFCSNYFHLKCEKFSKPHFPLPSTWSCSLCMLNNLPFSKLGDEDMTMTLHGMDNESIGILVEGAPSFSLKSLLDEMPGQKFDTDQFMNDTILSQYYTIADFANAKFPNKNKNIHTNYEHYFPVRSTSLM